jgi:arginine decarboxylase
MKTEWDVESAIATYNVEGWGRGYFTVNSSGNVEARPLQESGGSIDLLEVVNEARARNLGFPLVIRFQDLVRHRVDSVNRAFQTAMSEFGYRNQYRGVFPIKVNQLREVIEEIVDAGEQFHFGLEAGSKPELVAALAMHKDPESLIICNGYKDPAFIRIALLGRKLGKSVIIVIEKMEELGADRTRIVAVIGPLIRQSSYEVGPEFVARFHEADHANIRYFAPAERSGSVTAPAPGVPCMVERWPTQSVNEAPGQL